jgi:hypothetical protein
MLMQSSSFQPSVPPLKLDQLRLSRHSVTSSISFPLMKQVGSNGLILMGSLRRLAAALVWIGIVMI